MNVDPGGGVWSSCFNVVPGALYSFDLHAKLVSGSAQQTDIQCDAYASPCASPNPNPGGSHLFVYLPQSFSANWISWGPVSGALPSNAQSVACYLSVGTTVPASMRFDDIHFNTLAPVTAVELQTFDVR